MALVQDLTSRGHDQTVSRRGPGVALYNLRRYHAGDDSRAIHWKTTARQRRLMVRETEAEDQRRVALVLPTAVPDQGRPAFEQAVSLTASLAAWFHQQGHAIRLVVGEQEIPGGSGEAHYDAMLRMLALCHPVAAGSPVPSAMRALPGESVFVVLSWPDPAVLSACAGNPGRIIMAADYMREP
jgi:uncharacterized protein (DUF58 family)